MKALLKVLLSLDHLPSSLPTTGFAPDKKLLKTAQRDAINANHSALLSGQVEGTLLTDDAVDKMIKRLVEMPASELRGLKWGAEFVADVESLKVKIEETKHLVDTNKKGFSEQLQARYEVNKLLSFIVNFCVMM
jgi:hypothetical protein